MSIEALDIDTNIQWPYKYQISRHLWILCVCVCVCTVFRGYVSIWYRWGGCSSVRLFENVTAATVFGVELSCFRAVWINIETLNLRL